MAKINGWTKGRVFKNSWYKRKGNEAIIITVIFVHNGYAVDILTNNKHHAYGGKVKTLYEAIQLAKEYMRVH